jgi:hypothetical protein
VILFGIMGGEPVSMVREVSGCLGSCNVCLEDHLEPIYCFAQMFALPRSLVGADGFGSLPLLLLDEFDSSKLDEMTLLDPLFGQGRGDVDCVHVRGGIVHCFGHTEQLQDVA